MYAIVEDSGSQIRMTPGEVLDVDLRDVGEGAQTLQFDRVLVVGKDQGEATIGTPYVDGASVTAEIVGEIKGRKLDVIKFKRRKGYQRKNGHRQRYLRVKVTDIKG